jgi:shikimate dehydrogenase
MNAAYLRHCRLVVQCTPVGTYPNTEACIDLPWDGLTPEHLAVDLVYNPAHTAFLKRAEAAGAKTMNGKAMLIAQAEAAWEWWNATT